MNHPFLRSSHIRSLTHSPYLYIICIRREIIVEDICRYPFPHSHRAPITVPLLSKNYPLFRRVRKAVVKKIRNVRKNIIMRRVLANIVAVESSKYYILRVCVCVASVIHYAIRIRHIVICGLSRTAIIFHIIL